MCHVYNLYEFDTVSGRVFLCKRLGTGNEYAVKALQRVGIRTADLPRY